MTLHAAPSLPHCSHQQTPAWAKGHALPEPGSAPEGEVWFEYRAIKTPVLIATSVDIEKDKAD